MNEQQITPKQGRWVIQIGGGYGAFFFEGTEDEAEAMRSHKAQWEGAVGRKRKADEYETKTLVSQCWNHPNYENRTKFACDCGACQ